MGDKRKWTTVDPLAYSGDAEPIIPKIRKLVIKPGVQERKVSVQILHVKKYPQAHCHAARAIESEKRIVVQIGIQDICPVPYFGDTLGSRCVERPRSTFVV